ncbi:sigma-70 family RNA polymerase sigma factor [Bacillus spongiae]|uniref:Sigma-70 family RNA polymerase sigma factor n=1 Tax=Bacillus spongiae TaxID=2683610 RepID=A0ABU8HIB1_9BACI
MQCFEILSKQYEPMIHKIIQTLFIYKNKEEFYQTGLIALWEANERFDHHKGSFSTFAYSYIRGRLLTELANIRKNEERMVYPREEFWCSIKDEASPPFIQRELLLSYCFQLTENQTKWVLYTCVYMLSIQEIAKIENVSTSAVKKWRKGATDKIRGYLSTKSACVSNLFVY